MEIVKENISIGAHSLILIDIGLEFSHALKQLKIAAEKHTFNLNKMVICQAMGTKNQKILYREMWELEDFTGVKKPYCMIIPAKKMHHVEKSVLEGFAAKKK